MRLPDIAVPLGVHGLQNAPLSTFTCSLVGAYRPFARNAGGGGPPSLTERYRRQADYVNRVRAAAREAEAQGFLLPEDAAIVVNAAAETPIFDAQTPSAPPR
ncbi:hypothetical protein FV222_28775 [Methylobacterium sp. WL103]|nr:hypothetical protein FV222_28775 [Methylobacterium sp. WL103]